MPSGRAGERDIDRGGCEVGRGRDEGRERVARVTARAVTMWRLQEIADGETLCVQRIPKFCPVPKEFG